MTPAPSTFRMAAQAHVDLLQRRGERGTTTLECMIVLSLLAIVFSGVTGLHLVAMTAASQAEASSIATNLARARLEQVLALPPDQIAAQDNTEESEVAAAGAARRYTVHTTVDGRDPARLDVTVTVTWPARYDASCPTPSTGSRCATGGATFSRTLQTRVYRPAANGATSP